jgi:CDP-2,3-bis-(O-geranylgeranyl)-sn-glycerol synthase
MLDHILVIVEILVLLGVANGTPIFASRLLGKRFNAPLDGGLKLPDGRPLFGPSKTVRGLVLSVVCTMLAAALLGFEWITGAGLASASMFGDLLSSFIKRRLGLRVHSQAFGLDQVPESLLPLLVLRQHLGLGYGDIVIIIATFIVLELLLSRLLYRLHVRDRPY